MPLTFTSTAKLLVALLVCVVAACAQEPQVNRLRNSDLVGRWVDPEAVGIADFVEFSEDGTARLLIGGELIGAKLTDDLGLRYRLDSSHSPAWLDLVAFSGSGVEILFFKGIVERVGTDSIRIAATNDRNVRPTGFSGNAVNLIGPFKRAK